MRGRLAVRAGRLRLPEAPCSLSPVGERAGGLGGGQKSDNRKIQKLGKICNFVSALFVFDVIILQYGGNFCYENGYF